MSLAYQRITLVCAMCRRLCQGGQGRTWRRRQPAQYEATSTCHEEGKHEACSIEGQRCCFGNLTLKCCARQLQLQQVCSCFDLQLRLTSHAWSLRISVKSFLRSL